MEQLPAHLKKYIVSQNYSRYTPVDQAVWRYILRQLRDFLSKNAVPCYLEGLEKTGIDVEQIPRIEDISKKLESFGWRALPVSGFIPPAAFMELQSLGVLPIASDIRSLDHLLYTPAPDIVHEAAGHAPILVDPQFAQYLRDYAQVARKAIISKEDLDLYEAIRVLSDVKENPDSSEEEISVAENNLKNVSQSISHVSEAAELGRMNWWTAEYGLCGSLENPKIFGAGLLSSVGESRWCLKKEVTKIPLSVDCLNYTYDITEPQPQLFVTPDFKTLGTVLEAMANKMAYRVGGEYGLKKIKLAQSVNTVELNSGIQISGVLSEYCADNNNEICYLRFSGPSQLSIRDQQISGHGKDYHREGFSTPLGLIVGFQKAPHLMTASDWEAAGLPLQKGAQLKFSYTSGIQVSGTYQGHLESDLERDLERDLANDLEKTGKVNLLSLTNARMTGFGKDLFLPEWGTLDLVFGTQIPSVFGGPADRNSFGECRDFVAARVPTPKTPSAQQKMRMNAYQCIRELRQAAGSSVAKLSSDQIEKELLENLSVVDQNFSGEWLLYLELLEIQMKYLPQSAIKSRLELALHRIGSTSSQLKEMIEDGIRLAEQRI